MTRNLTMVVIGLSVAFLFAAGVVALVLPFYVVTGQDVPQLLPADTLIYFRWSNTEKIARAAAESGVLDVLVSSMPQDQREPSRRALESALRSLKSVHFSLHKVSVTPKRVTDVDMLVVLETGIPGDLLSIMGTGVSSGAGLREVTEEDGCSIYGMDIDEMSGAVRSVFVCTRSGLVLISTDLPLLRDVLVALGERRRQGSLAEAERFRELWGQPADDVQGYISFTHLLPVLIASQASGSGLHTVIELFSLQDLRAAHLRASYDESRVSLDLAYGGQSAAYNLLSQAQEAKKAILGYLPPDTALFLTGSFSDGRKALSDFNTYVVDFLRRTGEDYGAKEYPEKFSELEEELNVDLAEAASLIVEAGVFCQVEERERVPSVPCFFARVRDRQMAARIMARLGPPRHQRGSETYRYLGEEIHTLPEDFVWVMCGDDVLVGRRNSVEGAIKAKQNAATQAAPAAWNRVKAHCPGTNGLLAFLDFGGLRAPAWARQFSPEFACGATLTVDAGIVHLSVASDRAPSVDSFFNELSELLSDFIKVRSHTHSR